MLTAETRTQHDKTTFTIIQFTSDTPEPPPVTFEAPSTVTDSPHSTTITGEAITASFEKEGTEQANFTSTMLPEIATTLFETEGTSINVKSTVHADAILSTVTVEEVPTVAGPTTGVPVEELASTVTDPTGKLIACFQDCIDHYGCETPV